MLAGRHDTPAKVAFYAAGTEILADSVIDLNRGNTLSAGRSRLAPIGVFSEYRADNAVAYVSPKFAGFTAIGAFIPGEDRSTDESKEGDGWADHWSGGLTFGSNAFKASLGYQETKVDDVKQKLWQVGGSADLFDAFKLGAHSENTDNFGQIDDADYEAWAVSGKWRFGNNAIGAVYTNADLKRKGDPGYKTDGWGLSGEHNFSKRTKVYAAYADNKLKPQSTNEEDDASDKVFSLGMIHSF